MPQNGRINLISCSFNWQKPIVLLFYKERNKDTNPWGGRNCLLIILANLFLCRKNGCHMQQNIGLLQVYVVTLSTQEAKEEKLRVQDQSLSHSEALQQTNKTKLKHNKTQQKKIQETFYLGVWKNKFRFKRLLNSKAKEES